MNINFIKSDEFNASKWSGGTTTQLAIYPEDAVYAERDFIWRISSAKVEVEESTFTKLNDYKRVLMILDGKLSLIHKDQHSAVLNQFESDYFSGAWETSSYGSVVDYNLMMNQNCKGDIEYIRVENSNKQINVSNRINELENKEDERPRSYTHTIYCYSGMVSIKLSNDIYIMKKGDFLQVDFEHSDDVKKIDISLANKSENPLNLLSSADIISAFVSY